MEDNEIDGGSEVVTDEEVTDEEGAEIVGGVPGTKPAAMDASLASFARQKCNKSSVAKTTEIATMSTTCDETDSLQECAAGSASINHKKEQGEEMQRGSLASRKESAGHAARGRHCTVEACVLPSGF